MICKYIKVKIFFKTNLEYTPRKYASMKVQGLRFPKQLNHEGHGRHLGPGSYKNIHPYTSTARYLTTGESKKSPRTYSIMKSSTKRFVKIHFYQR